MRVLMVCLGNICRSPTAEAALREAADEAGVAIEVDSAGTAAWHVGNPPDPRTRRAGAAAGLAVGGSARQVEVADFARFDLLVAMDAQNAADLRRLAPTAEAARKVVLLRAYEPQYAGAAPEEVPSVPDPYHGGPDGFREVVQIARAGAAGIVAAVREGRIGG